MAGPSIDPNYIQAQQQYVRHNALKGAKSTAPDPKKDVKFLFITLGVVAGLILILIGLAFIASRI